MSLTWFQAAVKGRVNSPEGPLRVVIMSATVDADRFSQYWGCPVLYVPGRQFPVNIRHVSSVTEDWQKAMLATIFSIHKECPAQEDILAFLTGQEEIETMARSLRAISREFPDRPRLEVITLYAAKTSEQQQQVFRKTGDNCRKAILATNIAETSVTIPGVRHVVDSARVKVKLHEAGAAMDLLKVVRVSKAQAKQRAGRAGREAEGTCYRLITAKYVCVLNFFLIPNFKCREFDELEDASVPEIQRSNLSNVVLTMMNIGVENVLNFDFMDAPRSEDIISALRQLCLLGAVGEDNKLTEQGRKMAGFPLEPRLTAAILAGGELGCAEEVLTIIALVNGENIFQLPANKEKLEEASQVHKVCNFL